MTAPHVDEPVDAALVVIYRRATELGLLGPREAAHVVERSLAYHDHLPTADAVPVRVADLGSGAGVPGLVLAVSAPWIAIDFVEISERRCAFLRWAIHELVRVSDGAGMPMAATNVVHCDAAELGHDRAYREQFDAVVARSFRSPAVTAETASALLRLGSRLIVSGSPDDEERWPAAGLSILGLEPTAVFDHGPLRIRTMTKRRPSALDRPRTVRHISWD